MEFGDIIYFLAIVVLMILGFLNDYRKRRKRQQEKATSAPYDDFQRQVENQKRADDLDDWWNAKPVLPPPPTVKAPPVYVRKDFQSSIGSAASYEGQSSLGQSAFAQGANFENFYERRRQGQTVTTVHPLLQDLLNDSGTEELRKGLIYREILQRKY
jgi:hypothetical protein